LAIDESVGYRDRIEIEFRRDGHVILDTYQSVPNHMHGILQIISLENCQIKPFEIGTTGTGLVPVLNDVNGSVENGSIDGDKTNAYTSENNIATSERMGTRPIPTPLYDIIGTVKSHAQNDGAFHVRKNGWPPFRKRLWLRFLDQAVFAEIDAVYRVI